MKKKFNFLDRDDGESDRDFHKRCLKESFVEMIGVLKNVKQNSVHKENLIKKLQELSS